MILIIPAAIGRAMSFLQQGFVVEAWTTAIISPVFPNT